MWVVGAVFEGHLQVWRASDGRKVLEVPWARHGVFTLDGKWFVTGAGYEFRFYRVGTWELDRIIPREGIDYVDGLALAVSRGLVALATSSRKVVLIDCQTSRVVVTLTHAEPATISWLSFDPSGTRLAVTRSGLDVVIWDLGLLNAHLVEFGLDSAAPPSSPRMASAAPAMITVERGNKLPPPHGWAEKSMLIATSEAWRGNWSGALTDASEAPQLLPHSATNDRAWILVKRGRWHLE